MHVICVHIQEVIICVTGWGLHLRAALGCLVRKRHLVILGPVMYVCGICSMSHDTLFNFTNEVVLLDL